MHNAVHERTNNPKTWRNIMATENKTNKNYTASTQPGAIDADKERDRNPDAITGAPGSHPVGTGIGAAAAGAAGTAAGAAAGAAIGTGAAPGIGTVIGGVVGAIVGSVAGGYAGKGIAEAIDPTVEDAYWRNEYRNRKYYDSSMDYESDFAPAYRYGWESYSVYGHRPIDEANDDLRSGWDKSRGKSRLEWDRAQHAVRDAWDRLKARQNTTSTGTTGSSMSDDANCPRT
jgi:hypothetical protein